MAWIFSLSAECGWDQRDARAFAVHFDRYVAVTDIGERVPCPCGVVQDGDAGWWVSVVPEGVSRSGVRHERDRSQMTQIGLSLYDRLRTAPPFRFALVGVEADEFRTFKEIDDDLIRLDFNGLVINDDIWSTLGEPDIFVPFSPGYRWRPFSGASLR
jgi:hypothetical protein